MYSKCIVSPLIRTPIAIIALKGVTSILEEEEEEEGVGSGFVRSVRDAEERRSVTAKVVVEGALEAWCWEQAYTLDRKTLRLERELI